MEQTLYIVVYRCDYGKWTPVSEGVLESERLAKNFIELKLANGSSLDWAIVEGRVLNSGAELGQP
jgi:hypothetical protein